MTLDPAKIDKVSDELRSFYRAESRSKKVKKLEPNFYKNVTAAIESLKAEAETYLIKQESANYIDIWKRIKELEDDFKALFQKRFQKIATLSVYELDGELMGALTPEEKEFITNLHNMIQDEYNFLLNKLPRKEEKTEEPVEENRHEAGNEPEDEDSGGEKEEPASEPKGDEYLLVRILGDQPPIAQPDRDYYLHDNDLVYLPEKFADILIKRKAALKVSL